MKRVANGFFWLFLLCTLPDRTTAIIEHNCLETQQQCVRCYEMVVDTEYHTDERERTIEGCAAAGHVYNTPTVLSVHFF